MDSVDEDLETLEVESVDNRIEVNSKYTQSSPNEPDPFNFGVAGVKRGKGENGTLFHVLGIRKNSIDTTRNSRKKAPIILLCMFVAVLSLVACFGLVTVARQRSVNLLPGPSSPTNSPTFLQTESPMLNPTLSPQTNTESPTSVPTYSPSSSPVSSKGCNEAPSDEYRYCVDDFTLATCVTIEGVIVNGPEEDWKICSGERFSCRCPDGRPFLHPYGCSYERNVGDSCSEG